MVHWHLFELLVCIVCSVVSLSGLMGALGFFAYPITQFEGAVLMSNFQMLHVMSFHLEF